MICFVEEKKRRRERPELSLRRGEWGGGGLGKRILQIQTVPDRTLNVFIFKTCPSYKMPPNFM